MVVVVLVAFFGTVSVQGETVRLRTAKDSALAKQVLEELLKANSQTVKDSTRARLLGALRKGDSLLAGRHYVLADSMYSGALLIDSMSSEAYAGRGAARIPTADPRKAREDIDKAIKLSPANLQGDNRRAVLKTKLGFLDSAIADCDYVIAQDQTNLEAFLARALALTRQGNYREGSGGLQCRAHDRFYRTARGWWV